MRRPFGAAGVGWLLCLLGDTPALAAPAMLERLERTLLPPRYGWAIAVSADGAHVYSASRFDGAVAAFAYDGASGQLVLRDLELHGVAGVTSLTSPASLALSPDGAYLYVGSSSGFSLPALGLAVFARDGGSGALSFVAATTFGSSGFTDSSVGIAIPADGAHVYAVSATDNRLRVFDRNAVTGEVTLSATYADGTGGIDGLGGAADVAISPDDDHVYVTAGESTVTVFSRDSGTGALTLVELHRDGVTGVDGIAGARPVAVSPDGAHVYVAGGVDDAIALFTRNAGTGALTFVGAVGDGVGGVDGLDAPTSLRLSPDGSHLYASAEDDAAIAVFARNAGTGALTFVEIQRDGVGGTDGLEGVQALAVAPDGTRVFAGGRQAPLAEFARSAVTGALTQTDLEALVPRIDAIEVSPDGAHVYAAATGIPPYTTSALAALARDATTGSVTRLAVHTDGIGGVDDLGGVRHLAISPDGAHVYATGPSDDAVTAFARDATTGLLTLVEFERDGVGGADGLNGALGVAVSADGEHVYVAGGGEDAVAVFARDAVTGALMFVEAKRDNVGVGGGDGIAGAADVAVSTDGGHVYVAGRDENAIGVFARDALTGALTFVEVVREGVGGVAGLGGAAHVALDAGGANVYVLGTANSTLATFARDPGTGTLTQVDLEHDGDDGVSGLLEGTGLVVSPDGSMVAVSASLEFGGFGGGLVESIATFARRADTGALAFVQSELLSPGVLQPMFAPVGGIGVTSDGSHFYLGGSDFDVVMRPYAPGFSGCASTPEPACATAAASALTIVDQPLGTDRLGWRWTRSPIPADFGVPSLTNYALCIYEESGPATLVLRALAPALGQCGQPCWRVVSVETRYRDRYATPEGLTSLTLKDVATPSIKVKARGDLLDVPTLPLVFPIRVQLQGSHGECFETVFSSAIRNDGRRVRASD